MATSTKFLGINSSGDFNEYSGITTSSGAVSGDIVALNGSALIDASLLPSLTSAFTPAVKTANFNAAIGALDLVDLATAGANVTCTLPDATLYSGQSILVMVQTVSAGHHVLFASTSSQTVNGSDVGSLPVLVNVNQTYLFVSDDSNWWTVSPVSDLAHDVTGTLGVANGGTGVTSTPSNGQLLIGNGSTYTVASLSSTDSTITITTGSGTLALTVDQANLTLSSIGGQITVTQSPGAVTATAGSTSISAGAMIYLDSSGLIQLADANTALPATGFAPAAISATVSGTVIIGNGPNAGVTSLTAGTSYFLGHNGAVTATPPTTSGYVLQKVGSAQTTTKLQVILGPVIVRG